MIRDLQDPWVLKVLRAPRAQLARRGYRVLRAILGLLARKDHKVPQGRRDQPEWE